MGLFRRRATLIGLVLAGLPAVAADPPPPPSIDKLVEQLASPLFPVRERATIQLRERGPAALPALRKALESKDEEVRKRAESLIPAMEIDEALLPKRLTLVKSAVSAQGFIQEVTKQTGYKVGFQGQVPPNFAEAVKSLSLTDVPFWEAVEQVGKATGTHPSSYDTYNKVLQLHSTANRSPFVHVRGPFRLEAAWVHEDRDVDLTRVKPGAEVARSARLTLAVNLLAEPRLTFIKVDPAKVDEAVDSEGNSLLEPAGPASEPPPKTGVRRPAPAPPVAGGAFPSGRGQFRGESLISSDVRLRRASETAKIAKVVRGTIPVKTILIRKPVVVSAKVMEASGATIKDGNETLVVTEVRNSGGNNIEVRVRVPRFGNDPYREWNDRFEIQDEAGNKYQKSGGGSSSNGREYTISAYFSPPFNNQKVGPPAKLVFEQWVVHDHAIPFEFRDVPLP